MGFPRGLGDPGKFYIHSIVATGCGLHARMLHALISGSDALRSGPIDRTFGNPPRFSRRPLHATPLLSEFWVLRIISVQPYDSSGYRHKQANRGTVVRASRRWDTSPLSERHGQPRLLSVSLHAQYRPG